MRLPGRPAFWFTLVAAWFGVLFWLSSQSPPQPPAPQIPHLDKVLHAGYFALGGLFFASGLRLRTPSPATAPHLVATVLFCAAVGAFDEWHQTFTPGRSGNDPWDWLADAGGGLLGGIAGCWLPRLLARRDSC